MNSIIPENYSSGILAWFARNRYAADMLMVMILVGGFVAVRSMSETVFPDLDPGVINIVVPYPGSTPEEVEEGINRRIEEAITGIEGIEKIVSVAREGSGSVSAELEDNANDREVLDDIKSAVEQIQEFPPEDAENPEDIGCHASFPGDIDCNIRRGSGAHTPGAGLRHTRRIDLTR